MIRRTYPKLIKGLSYPVISGNKDGRNERNPLLIYDVNAPFSPLEIKRQIENIIKATLVQLPGVSEVIITGAREMQIVIETNYKTLDLYNISKEDILSAIREKSEQQNLGMTITKAGQQIFVKVPGAINSISEIENTIISLDSNEEGKTNTLTIREIANVYLEPQPPTSHFRINGKNAVRLQILTEDGVNSLLVAERVKAVITMGKDRFPEGYSLNINYDETEFISAELYKIYYRSGLSALILLIFILILHRSIRYLTVLFSGIVINLCFTGGLIYVLSINVHLYTLAGLTVSLGLIMDNAIVMLDHLHKRKNKTIFIPLLAASLTTIAALLVIFLLPEEDKQNLTEFSLVISINLVISLLIAQVYTPSVYQLLYRRASRSI